MKLNGYGTIQWAILTPSGQLHAFATATAAFRVEYESKSSGLLLKDTEGELEPSSLMLRSTYVHEGKPCVGQHRYRLYVAPGADFTLRQPPAETAPNVCARLRFGNDAHEFLPRREAAPVDVPRSQWRKALAKHGIMLLTRRPKVVLPRWIEEYDEDSSGSLIYNRISGYWHKPPDSDSDLDAGFYFARHGSGWQGAAIDDCGEGFPDDALKLFFAALKPAQRYKIAERLHDHSFNVAWLPDYDGLGFAYERDSRHNDSYHSAKVALPGGPDLEFETGDSRDDAIIDDIFSDAINYLCTLRPGLTPEQDHRVLACLQAVEVGLKRRTLRSAQVQMWSIVHDGGPLTIDGENHGTRLVRLLKGKRAETKRRSLLQKRWRQIDGKITRWEALDVKILAADHGIGVYPSRSWIAQALHRHRRSVHAREAERRAWREADRLRIAAQQAVIAARSPDDVFVVQPHPERTELLSLQVVRGEETVERFDICRQGTRIFRKGTGLTGDSYTRAQLAPIVARTVQKNSPWLNTHGFRDLFRHLGLLEETHPVAA